MRLEMPKSDWLAENGDVTVLDDSLVCNLAACTEYWPYERYAHLILPHVESSRKVLGQDRDGRKDELQDQEPPGYSARAAPGLHHSRCRSLLVMATFSLAQPE